MIRNQVTRWSALLGLTLWLQPHLQAQEDAAKATPPAMLFYQPGPGNPAADNWCFKRGDLWYVYTLNGQGQDSIGVAVSKDLMLFENRGVAIPSVPGTWENSLFGGDTFAWKGKYHMLYSAPGPGMANAIGLAESEDLLHWKKHPGNPVMHHPDARWYEGATPDGMRGGISCRDVSVIEDAFADEWAYACFAASTGRGDYYRRGCIGLARSKNLIDWEYLPPLFAPGLYTAMEVPRVCQIGSKWYLTWLCAPWYGLRTDEDYGQRAYSGKETLVHYAVADKPLGPYRLPEDPTLFRGYISPYVIDLVHDAGEVLVTTTMFRQLSTRPDDRERAGLMPAMPIRQATGNPDKLEVGFPDKLRKYFADPLAVIEPLRVNNPLPEFQDVVKAGNHLTFAKTSTRVVELTEPTGADLLVDVDFKAVSGRVGLALRYDPGARSGCAVLVDPRRKELQFAEIQPIYDRGIILNVQERHNITSAVGPDFRLSVVQSRDYQVVFVNGVLAATYSFCRRDAGRVGLFLENASGTCVVDGIHARPDPDDLRTEHAARGKPVVLAHPYHASFPAGGAGALTDGKRGRTWRDLSYNWQGFAGVDLDATIDLGQVTSIRSLQSTYLQNTPNGIYLPTSVKYLVSVDGSKFDEVATIAGDAAPLLKPDSVIRPFAATLAGVPARYVRVLAANIHTIPAGYPAAGAEAWLFVDEIIVSAPKETH